jgi:hypothetical protein
MLDGLLTLMLGKRAGLTFTEADLRGIGINPIPPDTDDYDLYMD